MCDNLVFTLMGDHYMLGTGVKENLTNADPDRLCENLIIKYEIDNIPVTHVGIRAFTFHPRLKSIYIPNTIVFLGLDCFAYIPTLEKVIFEERYNSSLEFDRGIFYNDEMTIIRLPSKISSRQHFVFSKSKMEKVIYCGMDKIDLLWFVDTPSPTIFVHPLYPYNSFGNVTNLVHFQECGIYTKMSVISIKYIQHSFLSALSLYVIIFCY